MTQTTTPKTDLEIFQSYQIDALQKRNAYLESEINKAKAILNEILEDATEIEVKDAHQL
jgi:hypothetical protein